MATFVGVPKKAQGRSAMTASTVRNWLGLYVLILTFGVGLYFFVVPSMLVPLELSDKVASAEILVPFLVGQVATVFRFFGADRRPKQWRLSIPTWVVKAPPALVTVILGIQFILMGIGGVTQREELIPHPEAFKASLTFCVALLNASTVYVITLYFGRPFSNDSSA
jgi:hypothetical protein